jgi:hypothetical protein
MPYVKRVNTKFGAIYNFAELTEDSLHRTVRLELELSASTFESRLAHLYQSLQTRLPVDAINVSPAMVPMIEEAWADCKTSVLEDWTADAAERYFVEDVELLELGEEPIGFVFKSFGAAAWAFQQPDFETAITALAREGGDADTHCAIAGALLGCRLGYSQLPQHWLSGLRHPDWLERKVQTLIQFLESH